MKRTYLLAFFLTAVCGLLSCSDSKKKSAPEIEKQQTTEKTAANVVTDKHLRIPNSNLYIIPPVGFAVEETPGTLAQTDGTAHFMQMQILSGYTPTSFFEMMKGEADKNFPGTWREESVTVNGHAAKIYHSKNAGYMQYFFVFTDGYTDGMIIGNYEEKDAATAKAMYEALKTVLVKK
ncbi:MAG: hypothetical protein RIR12_2624 [Bacteroidota bacterium]|jgi:hypothetical protein